MVVEEASRLCVNFFLPSSPLFSPDSLLSHHHLPSTSSRECGCPSLGLPPASGSSCPWSCLQLSTMQMPLSPWSVVPAVLDLQPEVPRACLTNLSMGGGIPQEIMLSLSETELPTLFQQQHKEKSSPSGGVTAVNGGPRLRVLKSRLILSYLLVSSVLFHNLPTRSLSLRIL